MIAADGLSIDPGLALNLPLGNPLAQKRVNRRSQMGLQDVHSFPPSLWLKGRSIRSHYSCFRKVINRLQVGEFQVAISGGIWAAAGAIHYNLSVIF